jgi:hypothetical protein
VGEAGWLHRLRLDEWRDRPRQRRRRIQTQVEPTIDFDALAAKCESALGHHRREMLAAELGVTAESLLRLQVGWSEQHRSFTFPMRDSEGMACGIRLRRIDGSKWAVRGSKQGLFLPRNFPLDESLMVCEGPSDTAAALMLCFNAIGRPSCNGGTKLILDVVERWHPADVVIVADSDAQGQRGARYLASRLVGYVPGGVRIVIPPAKDARDWVRSGADRLDVLDAIESAPTMTLTYARRPAI